MPTATNCMFWSKVFIISEMTTKRCDSERDMVCCWCGYSASWGLKMNHRKASGDWVTKYKNTRGNHFHVNKCKMTHDNTILTLQTNLIMAPTWLLLLERFYRYNTWLCKNNTNIRCHCWIKIFFNENSGKCYELLGNEYWKRQKMSLCHRIKSITCIMNTKTMTERAQQKLKGREKPSKGNFEPQSGLPIRKR